MVWINWLIFSHYQFTKSDLDLPRENCRKIVNMKTTIIIIVSLSLLNSCGPGNSLQKGQATPIEVVKKVHKAAALLANKDINGLEIIRDSASEFKWKDTYIFVVNCEKDLVMANSAFPEREGGDIKQHTDYNGKRYGLKLCDTAKRPGGDWVEYVWLKPGGARPLRKISYVISVKGLPYQVGAGIYNEDISIEELRQLTESYR